MLEALHAPSHRALALAAAISLTACGQAVDPDVWVPKTTPLGHSQAPPAPDGRRSVAPAATCGPRFGIEFEVIGLTGYPYDICCDGLRRETLGLPPRPDLPQAIEDRPWWTTPAADREGLAGRGWRSDCDISVVDIASRLGMGEEIISPILDDAHRHEVGIMARLLREAGASTSPDTGMHVHVDAAALDADALLHLLALAVRHEAAIFRTFRTTPRRQRAGAAKLFDDFARGLHAALPRERHAVVDWYVDMQSEHRTWVDLSPIARLGTVEFRLFNGTVDPELALLAVDFARAMVVCAQRAGPFTAQDREALLAPVAAAPDGDAALAAALAAVDASLPERLAALRDAPLDTLGPAFAPPAW